MLRLRARVARPAAARRWLCAAAAPSATARETVLRLAGGQPGSSELAAEGKFELLTACEREFNMQMPHAALTELRTIDDAASWWEAHLKALEAAAVTELLPPNVRIFNKNQRLEAKEFMALYSRRFYDDVPPIDEPDEWVDEPEPQPADDALPPAQ